MKKIKKSMMARILGYLALAMFILPVQVLPALAADTTATTKVKHKPIKYFVPNKRIQLETEIADKEGVNLGRCYFKAAQEGNFVFVPMKPKEGAADMYVGVLPAPSESTETIQYIFLVVNGKNQVTKTQQFAVLASKDQQGTPAWQNIGSEGQINVSTELAQAPEAPVGFSDSIAMDVTESSARFGFVAGIGIYSATQIAVAGGSMGTAAAATSAGTVAAAASGISMVAVAAGIVGVAAVAGGVAAANSGGGDKNSYSYSPNPLATAPTAPPVTATGVWRTMARCIGQSTNAWDILINLNTSAGGGFTGSGSGMDYNGTPLQVTLSGTYDANSRVISVNSATTFTGSVGSRLDIFTTTLTSNDTGYVSTTQSGSVQGCPAEERMIKQP